MRVIGQAIGHVMGKLGTATNLALALALACASAVACDKAAPGRSGPVEAPPSAEAIPGLLQLAGDDNADVGARVDAIADLTRAVAGADTDARIEPALRTLWSHTERRIANAAAAGLRRLSGLSELSFARTAVMGASVSAGFMGSPVSVELERGLAGKPVIHDEADVFFFKAPEANGQKQVTESLAFKPTVVFALDFVFWYVYVAGADLDYRRARMGRALKLLEQFQVPVIVGDIPDMRTAATWMLPPAVVPPPEHLQALNSGLHAWAADRLNTHVVPLAAWGAPLLTGGTVEDNGQTLTAAELVSVDGLHLNPRGVRYLLRQVDRELEQAFVDTAADALRVVD